MIQIVRRISSADMADERIQCRETSDAREQRRIPAMIPVPQETTAIVRTKFRGSPVYSVPPKNAPIPGSRSNSIRGP